MRFVSSRSNSPECVIEFPWAMSLLTLCILEHWIPVHFSMALEYERGVECITVWNHPAPTHKYSLYRHIEIPWWYQALPRQAVMSIVNLTANKGRHWPRVIIIILEHTSFLYSLPRTTSFFKAKSASWFLLECSSMHSRLYILLMTEFDTFHYKCLDV